MNNGQLEIVVNCKLYSTLQLPVVYHKIHGCFLSVWIDHVWSQGQNIQDNLSIDKQIIHNLTDLLMGIGHVFDIPRVS